MAFRKEIEDFFWRVINLLKRRKIYCKETPVNMTPPASTLKCKQYKSFSPHFRSYTVFSCLISLVLSFIYSALPLLASAELKALQEDTSLGAFLFAIPLYPGLFIMIIPNSLALTLCLYTFLETFTA